MVPSTGSETLDVVLQLAVIAALLASLVLLVRNYRGR
ncbi:LPXTG cell wall anchor domain-containing protein [Blastococcus aurantiacus]|nr:LPXTG cell wall anchor domain-containing protein [Blastococcus aurantiacus]